jgi:glycosyltransferase involved in cell wall biosynthesis
MKVLVVNNAAPFIRGGAEELADHLVVALNAVEGVRAELLRIPFAWQPSERLIEEILLNQSLRLWNVDRVIGLKFPAYLIPHADKTLWLLHQFRQAYDLGDAGQGLAAEGRDLELRRAIQAADDACFADARKIFTNSATTRDRLARYNGFAAEVLEPPLNDAQLFTGGEACDYVFAGGRVGAGKRQHLLVEAMATVPGSGRLVIAGPPDDPGYAARLEALVEALDLTGRVELRFGFHPRAQIAEWVNGARTCAYLPFDEDSLGYVTMEAFAAGKPVVTTLDAGGLLAMVTQETGWVVDPEPAALSAALDGALNDPASAARRGDAAASAWRARGLTWPATVKRLLD